MKKKFYLSHFALYAKGFYNKSGDVWEDLLKILQLDDYTPFDKNDVIFIVLNAYESCFNIKLINFLSDIHKDNCWKIGYPNNLEYDMYTAIMYKIISDVRYLNINEFEKRIPKYSKLNPRPYHIELKRIIEMFKTKNYVSTTS